MANWIVCHWRGGRQRRGIARVFAFRFSNWPMHHCLVSERANAVKDTKRERERERERERKRERKDAHSIPCTAGPALFLLSLSISMNRHHHQSFPCFFLGFFSPPSSCSIFILFFFIFFLLLLAAGAPNRDSHPSPRVAVENAAEAGEIRGEPENNTQIPVN